MFRILGVTNNGAFNGQQHWAHTRDWKYDSCAKDMQSKHFSGLEKLDEK